MPKLFNDLHINDSSKKSDFKSHHLISLQKNRKTKKHFPSPIREWYNSIYVYNKNSLNLIPSITTNANKTIKNYFNLYNWRLEKKMRTKRLLRRWRKLISNRYYISNPSNKHTNNKVIVNMYIFNRQKLNYSLALKKLYLRLFFNIKSKKINLKSKPLKNTDKDSFFRKKLTLKLIKRLNTINKKGIKTIQSINKNKFLLLKGLKNLENKKYKYNNFSDLTNYTRNFYKVLINKSLKKLRMFFYYRQLLHINKTKVNYTYLQYLKKYIEKLYNKNVEFNMINLKRFYLNSDILSESIKLKISKNRRKMLIYLNKVKNKIKIWKKKVFLGYNFNNSYLLKPDFSSNSFLLKRYIVNNLKYKHITGFRLEAKGRLTKRFTASRSISKTRYKGNLLDIDSSYRGESTTMLKGNLRSNTQYTMLKSKSRIGSFGIKGWVSGN